jgi:hypothetical protein
VACSALADQHGHALAGIEHLGRAPQVGFLRQDLGRRVADARKDAAMLADRRGHRVHLLHVVRHDYAGHGAFGHGDAHRAIDQMTHLRGRRAHLDVVAGDVLEQAEQVDLLLVVAAERRPFLLADDRDHGRVIEPGVVQAVQEVDRARAGGRHAHARLAGELGVRARHEGGDLLVRHLDEREALLGARERAQDAVDAVAGIAVDPVDAPRAQALQHEIADVGHRSSDESLDLARTCLPRQRRPADRVPPGTPAPPRSGRNHGQPRATPADSERAWGRFAASRLARRGEVRE